MNKKNKLLFLIWLLLISIPILSYFIKENNKPQPGIKLLDDNLTIEAYNVTLSPQTNNKITVREDITVYNSKLSKGLEKIIPKRNNQNERVYVSEVHVNGEFFEFDENTNAYIIKIGNNKINSGNHELTIRYDIDLGTDQNKGFDLLSFPLFETTNNTIIKDSMVTINMPKEFNEKNISFKMNNKKLNIKIEKEDKTIIAKMPKNNKNTIVFEVKYNDNYFINSSNNYGAVSLLINITMILVGIVIIILWIFNRINKLKGVEEVEYYPPNEYDVAELGYLNGEKDIEKLCSLLLASLASKGYISVEGKKIKNITKSLDTKYARIMEVVKLKNSTFENTPQERKFLDKLFFNEITYITKDFGMIYKTIVNLQDKGYIKLTDSVKEVTPELKSKVSMRPIKYTHLTQQEAALHKYLFSEKNEVELNEETLDNLVPIITAPLNKAVIKKVHNEPTTKLVKTTIIVSVMLMVIWSLIYLFVYDMNPKLEILYFISYGFIFIASLVGIIIERFTPYGEKISAKTEKFKKYLETAESGTLDEQITKNKNYFYDIFPYATALGIKDKWFEAVKKSTVADEANYKYLNDMEV